MNRMKPVQHLADDNRACMLSSAPHCCVGAISQHANHPAAYPGLYMLLAYVQCRAPGKPQRDSTVAHRQALKLAGCAGNALNARITGAKKNGLGRPVLPML
jgi:hypothetical protein